MHQSYHGAISCISAPLKHNVATVERDTLFSSPLCNGVANVICSQQKVALSLLRADAAARPFCISSCSIPDGTR